MIPQHRDGGERTSEATLGLPQPASVLADPLVTPLGEGRQDIGFRFRQASELFLREPCRAGSARSVEDPLCGAVARFGIEHVALCQQGVSLVQQFGGPLFRRAAGPAQIDVELEASRLDLQRLLEVLVAGRADGDLAFARLDPKLPLVDAGDTAIDCDAGIRRLQRKHKTGMAVAQALDFFLDGGDCGCVFVCVGKLGVRFERLDGLGGIAQPAVGQAQIVECDRRLFEPVGCVQVGGRLLETILLECLKATFQQLAGALTVGRSRGQACPQGDHEPQPGEGEAGQPGEQARSVGAGGCDILCHEKSLAEAKSVDVPTTQCVCESLRLGNVFVACPASWRRGPRSAFRVECLAFERVRAIALGPPAPSIGPLVGGLQVVLDGDREGPGDLPCRKR